MSVGVGSVAIAALIFGSSLSSSTVAADEVGGGATAHYTYVEEQELTDQEKGLIKKDLPAVCLKFSECHFQKIQIAFMPLPS